MKITRKNIFIFCKSVDKTTKKYYTIIQNKPMKEISINIEMKLQIEFDLNSLIIYTGFFLNEQIFPSVFSVET